MSSKMPGWWPTLRGYPDEQGNPHVESSAGGTSSGSLRHRIGLGSIRSGVSYSFRRTALRGLLDDLKVECVEAEKGVPGVEDTGVPGQKFDSSSSGMNDRDGEGQATPDSMEDVDMALPPFPNLVNTADETDWAKYLLWMEDGMTLEERTNNNMLLVGNVVRQLSSDDVITHLRLDVVPTSKRRLLLFKDLPAMYQGQHDGLAMYILGYDPTDLVLFVRRFERLSSKLELLPRYWDCGKEAVGLGVGQLLSILRDVDLGDASTSHARVLPEWNEEFGFKVVVVTMLAQWVLDFRNGFWMMDEIAEMAQILLLRWRDSLSKCFAETAFAHQIESKNASHQFYEGDDKMEGVGVVSMSKSVCLKTAHSSGVCDHKTATQALPSIDGSAREMRDTYDSDEVEEWAALEEWATRNKSEKQVKSVSVESEGRAATWRADVSADHASEPNNPFLTPERGQSPVDTSGLVRVGGTKRLNDSSVPWSSVKRTKRG